MQKSKNDMYSVESFVQHISISMSDATVTEYGNNLKYFLKFLDKHPKKITKNILMRFVYEMMSKKLSASMVLLRITSIKKYYKYLIYFNLFNRVKFIDIFENLELPKITQQKQKIYMASDVKNIVEKLEKFNNSFESSQTIIFILIASTTGARRREIAGVKVTDIDFESNHIYFYKTKSKLPRVIKISEYVSAKIKEYLTVRENHVKEKTDMLFLSNKGYESNVDRLY